MITSRVSQGRPYAYTCTWSYSGVADTVNYDKTQNQRMLEIMPKHRGTDLQGTRSDAREECRLGMVSLDDWCA